MKDKKSLRDEYRMKREALSNDQLHSLSIDIANQVLRLDIWSNKLFHLFLPIEDKNEVRTEYIMQILQGRDKNIVVSRSNFKTRELQHFLVTDQTVYKLNHYGIPEPVGNDFEVSPHQLDVVFIPLLAADHMGTRIGYGMGIYDRFLSQCREDVIKIGISYFEPLDHEIKSSFNDVPLNMLVTPVKAHHFE